MKIELENIGLIKSASVELNGVTLVTGQNGSGKTTVSKALYSILNSTENLFEENFEDKKFFLYKHLMDIWKGMMTFLILNQYVEGGEKSAAIKQIRGAWQLLLDAEEDSEIHDLYLELIERIRRFIIDSRCPEDKKESLIEDFEKQIAEINANIEKRFGIGHYAFSKLNQTIEEEFHGQILPLSGDEKVGRILLWSDHQIAVRLEIQDNKVFGNHSHILGDFSDWNVIFIDDVNIVDDFSNKKSFGISHRSSLAKKLTNKTENFISKQLLEEKADIIFKKFNDVLDDEIEFDEDGQMIRKSDSLKIENMATGAKSFAIIKQLISNGYITDKTMLILDEPEVHLHPQWQNIYAALIVFLAKEVGTKILIASHSSQFALAVETVVRENNMMDFFKAYISEKADEMYEFKDVTKDLKETYYGLSKPLFDMKVRRDSDK